MYPAFRSPRALRALSLAPLILAILLTSLLSAGGAGAAAPTYTPTLSSPGPGVIYATPAGSTHPAGKVVQLRAAADPNAVFLGWTIDGVARGWAEIITVKMNANHTVVATFVAATDFADITAGSYYNGAIDELAARGIIKGYGDGRVGPRDGTLRAQMAALICRAVGWDAENRGNPFGDQGTVDAALWRNVSTLAHYGVAKGCGDGTYGPTDPVLRAQVVSFITRAMVAKGYWQPQPDNGTLYPDVPASSGHRADIATYGHYAGALPDLAADGDFAGWDQPATRAWFARALWRALDSHLGVPPAIQ